MLILTAALFAPVSSASIAGSPPRGLYALGTAGQRVPEGALADAAVTGVSLRAAWSDLEPEDGRVADVFGPEIRRARQAGKQVMLRVAADKRSPAWLYAAGAVPFEFVDANEHGRSQGQAARIPVPWDPVFLGRWTRLIAALGERHAADPSVVVVHMAGPAVAGAEMHLPRTPEDRERWKRVGYTPARLVGAWKVVVDAYAAAFPGTYLALNVALPVARDGAVEEVVAYAGAKLGRRLCLQHNALTGRVSPDWLPHRVVTSWRDRAIVGFQLLTSATPQGRFTGDGERFRGTLAEAFRLGLEAGASYFEIYPVDLRHDETAAAIRAAARHLGSGT